MEPDPREQRLPATGKLVLFPLNGPDNPAERSTAFLGAQGWLQVAVLIAAADGRVEADERKILLRGIAAVQNKLRPGEHNRLLAYASALLLAPPTAAQLKKLKDRPETERQALGRLAVRVARLDGQIDDAEHTALSKLARVLDLGAAWLKAALLDDGPPPLVETAGKAQGTPIPPPALTITAPPSSTLQASTLQASAPQAPTSAPTTRAPSLRVPPARPADSRPTPGAVTLDPDKLAKARAASAQAAQRGAILPPTEPSPTKPPAVKPVGPEPAAVQLPLRLAPTLPPVVLDPARLAQIRAETEQAQALLSRIFAPVEPEPPPAPPPEPPPEPEVDQPSPDRPADPLEGLPAKHRALLRSLAGRDSLSAAEFVRCARAHGLMSDGAAEIINDWALARFDELLLDLGEPIEIAHHLLHRQPPTETRP